MTGRYRPHLSLREGLEQPPFPSRFIVSDRSSPSRVRFAASRLGLLRADPGDALFSPLAHDKGYYHSQYHGRRVQCPRGTVSVVYITNELTLDHNML